MRYVSEKVLGYFCASEFESKDELLDYIKAECKELPDRQWQTLEEFKANPVEGVCFVANKAGIVIGCYWDSLCFHNGPRILYSEFITHVMPIPKPEAPK